MSKTRLISVVVLSAAIATPAFAQGPGVSRKGWGPKPATFHQGNRHNFRGAYNRSSGHYDPEFQRNKENFGFSGRDPSRVGGEDPALHPLPN